MGRIPSKRYARKDEKTQTKRRKEWNNINTTHGNVEINIVTNIFTQFLSLL